MNSVIINRLIFVLSILGVVTATYVLQSFLRDSSIFCPSGTGCEMVRKNPIAWPFGIPVPAFGFVGYLSLTVCLFLKSANHTKILSVPIHTIMLGIALFGVCFVTWFTFMELFVIKGICTWCAISAINMYIIFGLLVYSVYNKGLEK